MDDKTYKEMQAHLRDVPEVERQRTRHAKVRCKCTGCFHFRYAEEEIRFLSKIVSDLTCPHCGCKGEWKVVYYCSGGAFNAAFYPPCRRRR